MSTRRNIIMSRTGLQGALLVGSVPLQSASEVYELAVSRLGTHLKRIPDGETGERSKWINWQAAVFQRLPQFEAVPPDPDRYPPSFYTSRPTFRLRTGASVAQAPLGDLGYLRAAVQSYDQFDRMQRAGRIPGTTRFQVALPTPYAVVAMMFQPDSHALVEPLYEAKLLQELAQIAAHVPNRNLAVQWDVAIEFMLLESMIPSPWPDPFTAVIDRLARLGIAVSRDVELGYHLCYGDAGHRHFKEPADTALMVKVWNAVVERLERPVEFLHLPVPRNRDDDAYYQPLSALVRPEETELYLGLVHDSDGREATIRRIRVAQRHLTQFGIATECGFGRRAPETVPSLLELHASLLAV